MPPRRTYFPRHLLPVAAATVNSPSPLLVGWRSSLTQQVCVITSVKQEEMQEHDLASLLNSLAQHPKLQALWSHTSGGPQVIGQLGFNAQSQLPILITSSVSTNGGRPADIQLVLFDAPAASIGSSGATMRFFATSNPFDAIGQVAVIDDTTDSTSSKQMEPLGFTTDGESTSKPSELEQALHRINACRATEAIVQYFVRQAVSTSSASIDSSILVPPSTTLPRHVKRLEVLEAAPAQLNSSPSIIPIDFDFASVLSPPPSAIRKMLSAPFFWLASTFATLFFFLCERVLLPLLELRVLSLARLVSSVFAPGMHRRLQVQSVPLWQASHALGAVHAKVLQAVRSRVLNRGLGQHQIVMLGVPTIASVRAQEELWGGVASHAYEARLGIATGLFILALIGWFDGVQLPQPFQSWIPASLLDSTALRSSIFVVPPPLVVVGNYLSESLEFLLSSSAPAGLKLNHRLHAQLGRLLRQGITDQSALIHQIAVGLASSTFALAILRYALTFLAFFCMIVGVSLIFGALLDVVWVASLPLVLVHATLARVSSFTCSIFRSLLLLFRGQKRNILRGGRLDTFPMSANYEHVLLGTLGLACVTFLAPTIFLWHALATAARIIGAEMPRVLLWTARAALHCAPLNLAWMWIRDRMDEVGSKYMNRNNQDGQRIPAGIWMEVMPSGVSAATTTNATSATVSPFNSAAVTCLLLHSSSAPVSTLLFRVRAWMRAVLLHHPPARVVTQIVWGGSDQTNIAATA